MRDLNESQSVGRLHQETSSCVDLSDSDYVIAYSEETDHLQISNTGYSLVQWFPTSGRGQRLQGVPKASSGQRVSP